MPRRPAQYLLYAMLMLAVSLVAACGDDDGESGAAATATETSDDASQTTTVSVELIEFAVAPDVSSASPGEITFAAQNTGSTPHELLVVRTDLAPDSLPVEGAEVDESQLDIVVRIDAFQSGQTLSATAELEPGIYVLICNVPGHYGLGMTAPFTIV